VPTIEEKRTSLAAQRLGTMVRGKYRLDRVIGAGGVAVVYEATHRNDAEFAIKILHADLSRREDVNMRFLREGKAANSIRHPGVVWVVDDDVSEDGIPFLVMELLHGETIKSLWQRSHRRLSLETTLAIADALLDVLAAAHAKEVIHRDVNPANVFLTSEGTLKLLDFGIARVKASANAHGILPATATGVLLGTPAFMAPEQAYAKASEIDARTDVWAVGATMFSLLSGRPVHEANTKELLLVFAGAQAARPLRSVLFDVPKEIADVVDRALAFERSGRWPSAAAMQDALRAASLSALGEVPSRHRLVEAARTVPDLARTLLSRGQLEPPSLGNDFGTEVATGSTTLREAFDPGSAAPSERPLKDTDRTPSVALPGSFVVPTAPRAPSTGAELPATPPPRPPGPAALARTLLHVSLPPSTFASPRARRSVAVRTVTFSALLLVAVAALSAALASRTGRRTEPSRSTARSAPSSPPSVILEPIPYETSSRNDSDPTPTRATSGAHAAASAKPTNCNRPTWTDSAGQAHMRQECLPPATP
jgi:serine/threonine protein kinase